MDPTDTTATSSELDPHVEGQRRTAAQKILATLRELSVPGEEAGGMQMAIATLAMGMESQLGGELDAKQETGELDDFILALTWFLALHRSDRARQLLVLEVPRAPEGWSLPAGTKLKLFDDAARLAAAGALENPLR